MSSGLWKRRASLAVVIVVTIAFLLTCLLVE